MLGAYLSAAIATTNMSPSFDTSPNASHKISAPFELWCGFVYNPDVIVRYSGTQRANELKQQTVIKSFAHRDWKMRLNFNGEETVRLEIRNAEGGPLTFSYQQLTRLTHEDKSPLAFLLKENSGFWAETKIEFASSNQAVWFDTSIENSNNTENTNTREFLPSVCYFVDDPQELFGQ